MIKFIIIPIILIAVAGFSIETAQAVQTKLTVRAKAYDAKFIGESFGGANITIKDSMTGKVLAKGSTSGGTGDTKKIMQTPNIRGISITDANTAKFEASINIEEPTLLTIEAEAPYSIEQSKIKTSTQVWLLPGKDIIGDGIILEFHGFSVSIKSPSKDFKVKLSGGKASVPISAAIFMM
ncbi:MAG: hypothetical protein HQK93_00695 [Nitrospirae bacterium]|nr:hypothetical protein [Nitrospirota bacterium]